MVRERQKTFDDIKGSKNQTCDQEKYDNWMGCLENNLLILLNYYINKLVY